MTRLVDKIRLKVEHSPGLSCVMFGHMSTYPDGDRRLLPPLKRGLQGAGRAMWARHRVMTVLATVGDAGTMATESRRTASSLDTC